MVYVDPVLFVRYHSIHVLVAAAAVTTQKTILWQLRTPSATAPTPIPRKKKGFGRARRRPTHTHFTQNAGGRRGRTTTTLEQETIVGDADASANVSADAVSTDVPIVLAKPSTSGELDSTSKAANTDELSALLNNPAPQELPSSPMKPSALFPTNSAFYKTQRSTAAASSKTIL